VRRLLVLLVVVAAACGGGHAEFNEADVRAVYADAGIAPEDVDGLVDNIRITCTSDNDLMIPTMLDGLKTEFTGDRAWVGDMEREALAAGCPNKLRSLLRSP
jgi:hypothetical protein